MHDSSSVPLPGDPQRIARRMMQRAHTRDGLPEIAAGICFLATSALIYAQMLTRPGSAAFDAACLAFAFVIPALILLSTRSIKWVRERYLIEREGYVRARPAGKQAILSGVVAVAVSIALVAMVPRLTHPDQWLLSGTGGVVGVGLAVLGRSPRFVVLAFVAAATGIAAARSGIGLNAGFALLWAVTGFAVLLSGSIVLVRFLRTPPGD